MRRLIDVRPDDSLLDIVVEVTIALLFTTVAACMFVGIWALILYGAWSALT